MAALPCAVPCRPGSGGNGTVHLFDRMGPAILKAGEALDVKPHPHIGLSTVTYLFDGEIKHRDSLGTELVIRPGDINLMTAGRGIVHSERTPENLRGHPLSMSDCRHGLPCRTTWKKSTRPLPIRPRKTCL